MRLVRAPTASPSSPTPASSAPTKPASPAWWARPAAAASDGLECFYPEHDERTVARCLALAAVNDLVPTGGSDFHGETKPDVRLGCANGGRPVPDAILAGLKARWAQEHAARETGAPEPAC